MKITIEEINEQDRLLTARIQRLIILFWIVLGLLAYTVTAFELELDKKAALKSEINKKSPGAQTAGL